MKYPRSCFLIGPLLAFILSGALLAAPEPSDEGVPLNIGVRSSVDQKWQGVRKLSKVAHGKIYALVSVKEMPSVAKMVRPLDQAALAGQLRREMATQGFREMSAQEKPEIVLTVTYGRGFLRNPYLEDTHLDDVSPGIPTSTITSAKQAARQREPGFEAKAQDAQQEKLHITVTAWKYPEAKGEKPVQLWRTVMVADNPDHRDLNLAMPAMLAAGVRYFDRDIKDGEVKIKSNMPAGTVKLGPLDVIESDVSAR